MDSWTRIPRTFREDVKFYAAGALAFFVWSITPISWAIIAHWAFRYGGPYAPYAKGFNRIAWYHAAIEVPFSIFLWRVSRSTQPLLDPPDVDVGKLEILLDKCLGSTSPRSSSLSEENEQQVFQSRLRRWFHGAPLHEIKADNVREWLAWAFGGRELEDIRREPERIELINKALAIATERVGFQFEPGYNPASKCLRLTLDPVRSLHRPLGYYVVCNSVTAATILWLQSQGFKRERHGECEFLVLPPRDQNGKGCSYASSPILFLHGLGIGLGQYAVFARRLVHHPAGVVILLQPHISVDIWHRHFLHAPSKQEHTQAIQSCLDAHDFRDITILSHSNGTMVHGWLSRELPNIARRHVLVDPVCFRLWEGATSYAFLAKKWDSGIEILLGYFVAREIGVSYAISRRFLWWDMLFWVEDIGDAVKDRLQIVMGEKDVLVDVPAAHEYLVDAGVPNDHITICPKAQHGQALFMPSEGMAAICRLLGLRY